MPIAQKLIFLLGIVFAAPLHATCSDLFSGETVVGFARPNYRFVFRNGIEVDLVLGGLVGKSLVGSFLIAAYRDLKETREDAEVAYYRRHIFNLTEMETSRGRYVVRFHDRENAFTVVLNLSRAGRAEELRIRQIHFETENVWFNQIFPKPMLISKKDFEIMPEFNSNEINYVARSEGAAQLLWRILPDWGNNEPVPDEMKLDVEKLSKLLSIAFYSRTTTFNVRRYRGLVAAEIIGGAVKHYVAFTMIRTPADMFHLRNGLRGLGLLPGHPIFPHIERMTWE